MTSHTARHLLHLKYTKCRLASFLLHFKGASDNLADELAGNGA